MKNAMITGSLQVITSFMNLPVFINRPFTLLIA